MVKTKPYLSIANGLFAVLLNSCHAPMDCTVDQKTQDEICLSKEKKTWEWTGTGYDFPEIVSIATALFSPEAVTVCDGLSHISVNASFTPYEKCSNIYTLLQEDLPSFSLNDTFDFRVESASLEVFTSQGGYYTGSAPSLSLQDKEKEHYLSSGTYIVEEGCDNAPFYLTSPLL